MWEHLGQIECVETMILDLEEHGVDIFRVDVREGERSDV